MTQKLTVMIGNGWMMSLEAHQTVWKETRPAAVTAAFRAAGKLLTAKRALVSPAASQPPRKRR
jgi:hypothetical protein